MSNALWALFVIIGVNVLAYLIISPLVDFLQNRPRRKRRLPR